MSLRVKARERKFKIGKFAGDYRYVMMPELYSALAQEKVIREAALRSGVSEGVMHACWDAAGEVIKAWATEGHSVPMPGLGTMRFGLSAKSVASVNEVKTSLIKTRRIIFTPSTELKDELKNTSVIITCYDRDGKEVKRVTSADDGTIEEPDNTTETGEETENSGDQNGSTENGNQNENENENDGSASSPQENGGTQTGGDNSGSNSGSGNTGDNGGDENIDEGII